MATGLRLFRFLAAVSHPNPNGQVSPKQPYRPQSGLLGRETSLPVQNGTLRDT